MKITPKQQERLDEFDRKFGVAYTPKGVKMDAIIDPNKVKDFLLDSMQIAVQEERENNEGILDFMQDQIKINKGFQEVVNNIIKALTTEE